MLLFGLAARRWMDKDIHLSQKASLGVSLPSKTTKFWSRFYHLYIELNEARYWLAAPCTTRVPRRLENHPFVFLQISGKDFDSIVSTGIDNQYSADS
jgi:hypothetical protein